MSRTFDQHWARLVELNPQLGNKDTQLVISVPSFRKQLARAYDVGAESREQSEHLSDDFCNLFKGVF